MKSHDFSTYPQYNVRINTHLRIDAFIVGLGALYFLAFPDAAIHTVVSSAFSAFGRPMFLTFSAKILPNINFSFEKLLSDYILNN